MAFETKEQIAERIVRNEVHLCVSGLVHTLAQGYGGIAVVAGESSLAEICDQAAALSTPIPGYESAAREAGHDVRHDHLGFYGLTTEESELEDAGNPSAGFDGRPHFPTVAEAWRGQADLHEIEPHDREVYEHWAVSEWLAGKLEARGEKVDRDFAGLIVWARTTTGQAISIDAVIEDIAADLAKAA